MTVGVDVRSEPPWVDDNLGEQASGLPEPGDASAHSGLGAAGARGHGRRGPCVVAEGGQDGAVDVGFAGRGRAGGAQGGAFGIGQDVVHRRRTPGRLLAVRPGRRRPAPGALVAREAGVVLSDACGKAWTAASDSFLVTSAGLHGHLVEALRLG
ncbi:hypothetical protein [Streptomyces sp. NPDC054834]